MSDARLVDFGVSQIVDFLPDPTFAIDREGRVILWNKAAERLTGIPAQEMLGKGNYEHALPLYGRRRPLMADVIVNPDRKEEIEQSYQYKADGSMCFEGEVFSHITQRKRYLTSHAGPIYDPAGNLIGAIQTICDITERRQVELALVESEEKFRLLFESSWDGYLIMEDGRYIDCNASALRIAGLSDKSQLLGKRPMDFAPQRQPDGLASPEKSLQMIAIAQEKGFHHFEWVRRRPDGGEVLLDVMLTAIPMPGKQLLLAAWRDLTERKLSEEELRRSEERYRLVADNIHDMISIYDLDFNFVYMSPSVERIAGYRPRDMLGTPALGIVVGESRQKMQAVMDEIRRLIAAQDPMLRFRSWTVDLQRVIRNGKTIWTESNINVMLDDRGRPYGIISVTRDIDQRKLAEEQAEFYREHLQRSQRLEAIGTLAGGIAHDFNNILSVIVGFSELIRDDPATADRQREMIDEVLKAGVRAKDLVQQILTFSRQVEVTLSPLAVHLIVKEALKLLRASIPSTIDIVQHINPRSGSVLADPTQIHQVVMNLCTNAYQAMQEGGTMKVSLDAVVLTHDAPARPPDLLPGDYVKLSVKDTGCGMDEATARRIFEPFFSTKEKACGTGLGLAITHGIVKKLGGTIVVTSSPGAGSTFEVFLPRFGIDIAEDAGADQNIPAGKGERILLVDDEPEIVKFAALMLEQLGYRVSGHTDSLEALDALRSDPLAFDLVLTDQTMPNLRGDHLAVAVLQLRPDIPIVLMTGYSAVIDREAARKLGIKGFIDKPFSSLSLAGAVRGALDSRLGSS